MCDLIHREDHILTAENKTIAQSQLSTEYILALLLFKVGLLSASYLANCNLKTSLVKHKYDMQAKHLQIAFNLLFIVTIGIIKKQGKRSSIIFNSDCANANIWASLNLPKLWGSMI